ncbi:MAG: class I SAM-dependent methyltransferase [Acidobacteriota bacterium]
MTRNDSDCPICSAGAHFIKLEKHDGLEYRVYRCSRCRSLFCPDHHAACSPEYVSRRPEDIDATVLWCQGGHKLQAYRQLFVELERRGRRVSSLLDIGCGTGGFLDYTDSRGVQGLYGFDASAVQAEVARRNHANVRCAVSLSQYLGQLSDQLEFDLITMWDVIEHLREPRGVLAEIASWCRGNPLLFVSTPNSLSEYCKFRLKTALGLEHTFLPWEHVLYFSREALERVLREHGFEVILSSGTTCYRRPATFFELARRAAYLLAAPTVVTPQLFVLSSPRGAA